MATVGSLGDVIFTVSDETVMTLENIVWSSSATWQEHERHLKDPALEYVGMGADEMSFDIKISVYLGVSVMDQIVKLFTYEREGRLLPLTIGKKAYGKYRWVILNTQRKFDHVGKYGLESATVSLKLKGYTK